MERLEYEIETLTPLFCHGSDKDIVELRASSIKGLMRYWWRIMKMNDNNFDITKLKEKEDEIFGSTEKKCGFKINIIKQNEIIIQADKIDNIFNFKKNIGLKYIWMLGPVSREGQKEVYYNIIYPAKYKVIIKSNNKVQEDVKKSFEYLILYGGIGQKSRRGLGKFYSKNIKNKAKIDNLFFSKQTFDSYIEALNYLGCIYWAYRVKLKNKKEKYFLGAGKQIINNKSYDRIPSRIFFQLLKLDNNKIQPGYLLIYNNISKIELDNFKKFILNEEEIKNTLIKNMENYKTRANKIFLYRLYQKINEYLNDKFLKFEEVK